MTMAGRKPVLPPEIAAAELVAHLSAETETALDSLASRRIL